MIYINGRFLTQTLTGSQRFAYEMTKSILLNYPEDVTILVPPAGIKSSYIFDTAILKVIGSKKGLIWEQIDLPRFMLKTSKQLLINLINTAPLLYSRQIVTIHDMTTFINPKWFNKAFSTYYRFILPLIAKNSLAVLTVSECSKKDILKYIAINSNKINVLYNSVSNSVFNTTDTKGESALDQYKIVKQKYLLAVSSLDPRKNFLRLIKAYSHTNIEIPLVIVGAKNKVFSNFELNKLTNNSKIIFTNYVDERTLVSLYKNALCFIYPSLYEGFGMPPLEAMACGCATIVSNTSSLPEVCGDASLYVDPLDISSITEAIVTVVNNVKLREELIIEGKKQVEKFSWRKSGMLLKSVIDNLQR